MSNPRTVRLAAFGVVVAALMIAQQLASKAVRDAYFLTQFDATQLPTFMMIASTLSVISVLGTARLYRRWAPARLVPLFFFGSAAWFVGEWVLSETYPKLAAASLYLHTTSFGAVVVSGFWSVINETFDPHTAKRAVARIAGGATVGGMIGGIAAWQGAGAVSIRAMILTLAIVNVACALGMLRLGGRPEETGDEAASSLTQPSAFSIMEETPYLWHLALLVALSAFGAAGFDYVLKARASATYTDSESLVSFFALFYLALGVLTFVFQLFASRALAAFGLVPMVATMPGAVVLFGGVAVLGGGLFSAVLLRGAAAVLESSLYRSGYELLYTPLTPDKKRPTKTLIDVGGDKLGAAAGSGLALAVVGMMPGSAETVLLGVAIVCSLLALGLCRALHRGYVGSLADNLRSGALDADALLVEDATTKRAVEETIALVDREELLSTLDQSLDQGIPPPGPSGGFAVSMKAAPSERFEPEIRDGDEDELLRGIAALRSREPERAQDALHWFQPLPPPLVPLTIALLDVPEVAEAAALALRRVAPVHVGSLADALVAADTPSSVRRRLPSILGSAATQWAVDGLVRALDLDDFEVRFRVAMAIAEACARRPDLRVASELAEAAIVRAAEAGVWTARTEEARARVLAFAFLLLTTQVPPEPLRLALDALADDDPSRRGTGLEYLENVLPERVKDSLQPLLDARDVAVGAREDPREILRHLQTSGTSRPDLQTLIARFSGAGAR